MPARVDELPLFRVIDGVRADEGRIVARVEVLRAQLAEKTGLQGRALAHAFARELVDEAAFKSASIGAVAALPWSLPVVGTVGSILITVLGSALWQLANEVEMTYAVAMAYRSQIPPDELRLVSFWLVRLTNYDDLRSRALTLGVRLTLRKLIEKLVAIGLTRAFAATAPSMMMAGMMRGAEVAPSYVQAVSFLGVPVLALLSWRSAQATGERAIEYFSEGRTTP